MLHATYKKYPLQFKKPAGTSRGVLNEKPTFFLTITDTEKQISGKGECSIIPGLSIDDRQDFEEKLQQICEEITLDNHLDFPGLANEFPAIQFGLEMAKLELENGGGGIYFQNDFSFGKKNIIINGLIWMGTIDEMWQQVLQKSEAGFNVIKLKIGALNFENELKLLEKIRTEFGAKFEIRLDANGAFKPDEAIEKLEKLAAYNIHSIEQPVKAGNWDAMTDICKNSAIPVALDEELIGIYQTEEKENLLDSISPQYIILKPSLLGGFAASDEWIDLAERRKIGWWATSALESNLGLTAIAQWVGGKNITFPQGLGTGGLFTNNVSSKLNLEGDKLSYLPG